MGKKKKRGLAFLGVCIVLAGFSVYRYIAGAERGWEDIEESKTLYVVTDYCTFDYTLTDGRPSGFNYELIKMFVDQYGLSLDITIESDLNASIEGLNSGKYDVLLRNIPVTAETKAQMHLSAPIMKSRLVLVQRGRKAEGRPKPVRYLPEIEGEEVFIISSSPYRMVLDHINEETGLDLKIVTYASNDAEMLNAMVARGQIDYAACDILTAEVSEYFYPQLDVETTLGNVQYVSWGLSRHKGLDERVDAFIDSVKAEPVFIELQRKYYK